jgi:predicted AAA+ superfamily ATPase
VVFCDDLSFEAGAAAAKSLKSALEGGVAGPPENVLFIATSNRRHLAPQSHDEDKGLLATAEEAEETVSVSDRFGLWIGFPPMDQTAYLGAVNAYAQRFDLQTADLDLRALQWSQLLLQQAQAISEDDGPRRSRKTPLQVPRSHCAPPPRLR